ncbi:MAG: hypothetical protein A3B96_00420 [Candidatus Spechtbacteria bacterium RIFCSPHIGHO2_02_FULL_43_15b]|uniref:Uncharacterized protein n=1 Tax=Candidatus Spechtbacteria bacterium RIFCSPHIGHO2_01_FULL_43_30 TaxID=1802158 RepID=A0A1G2H6A0_9BACT|nr:MAG: hypothetical protein A2827_00845 [Candidatus Spechtbacteria bacterium RIFCSPHIGHO2_01_FULL_43_30]OGZ59337.1 MAG: hypothetical protein A3B96_00420 [Candidatus Spechtbacteria bacterium RIFCSPHIGHO2_02_FULL_43_15b]
MTANFLNKSKTEKELEVEISSEDFSEYLDKAARKLSENLNTQGFRKGHAPRSIIEKKVGSDNLYKEAAELAMQRSYAEALNGNVLSSDSDINGKILKSVVEHLPRQAVSEVSVLKLAPNNPFVYKIIFKIPYFMLAEDYRGIAKKVIAREKREVSIEESEVEETLNWLRRNHKKGVSGTSSPSKDKNEEELPELTDEFAKNVGNFQNVAELRNNISEGIKMEKEKKEKDRIRIAIVKEIMEKSEREIPKEVTDNETRKIEEEFKDRISQMGLELDNYLKRIEKKKEDLEGGWRDSANERIETYLVLDAVAEKENIEIKAEDIEEESKKFLKRFGGIKEAEERISTDRLEEYVRDLLRSEKALESLEKVS